MEFVKIGASDPKKDEHNGFTVVDTESDVGIRPYIPFRERLSKVLHSHKFHVVVISLVIFDCLLIIAELFLDLHLADIGEAHDDAKHVVPHVLHYISITILSIFIIEIMLKLYAFRLEFFKHKLEVFDAVVVLLSFALDVTFRGHDSASTGSGLIIILRLWRVARILNGVVLSVKTQAEDKLSKVRKMKDALEQELCQSREYISGLEMEIEYLKKLLEKNGIQFATSQNSAASSPKNVIRVEAEVNDVSTG